MMPSVPPEEEGYFTPRPDPTVLTTQQLRRETLWLRELMEEKVKAAIDIVELLRDKVERNTAIVDKVPVHETRINHIDERIDEAILARKEQVHDQITTVKDASTKQEATFAKQIDQLGTVINALGKGLDDKIDDLKTRTQALEARPQPAGLPTVLILGTIALGALMASITAIILHETTIPTEVHERVAP